MSFDNSNVTRSMTSVPDTSHIYLNERSLRRFLKNAKKSISEYEKDFHLLEQETERFRVINNSLPVIDDELENRLIRLEIQINALHTVNSEEYCTPERFEKIAANWIRNWKHLKPLIQSGRFDQFLSNCQKIKN